MTNSQEVATEIVDHHLGTRLISAGEAPGLRETVVDLVAEAFPQQVETLMGQQLDLLTHPSGTQWPDAYLADESAAEDALQQAAAGLRVALARSGQMSGKAQIFERNASASLRDDPRAALRAELARVPRPLTRPQILEWSLDPAPWFTESPSEPALWPPAGLYSVAGLLRLPGGVAALPRVSGGPHEGWVQIGFAEGQLTPARRYPADEPARQIQIIVGLEADGSDTPSSPLPLAKAPWQLWTRPLRRLAPHLVETAAAARHIGATDQPLVALTDASTTTLVNAPLPSHGLGLPHFVLAPAVSVIAALGLEPTEGVCGFSLNDAQGEALVGRQWRGHLIHDGHYKPLLPAIEGADLLIRPDLFTRLHNIVGATRCHAGLRVVHQPAEQLSPIINTDDRNH
ncbi:hypothetical protein [Streptomyces yaizuensis]|uniref:Uncharacterized protein n=1 Tax=Streptomyces yaizuensis TaxID=2989713 RepID=A0ABQ5NZ81_9ACTN|nr:hypothetical protein [Streptomyces sp. YSPA8]GLF95510.1 hypothetical protein SYYSPA8_14455 [Streptomyces sp. YSPA8]